MVGPGVTGVKEGDRVAIPWLGYACGHCEYCMSGWSTLCEQQLNTGYFIDGAYAEYALAFAKYVVKVPKHVNPLEAAPLACAGVTTYKAVKMSGARSSDLVAIFGIGGLGHLAVQYAKIAGATVVAVDLVDEKLEMAKKLGADYTVNGKAEDPVEAIKKLGGADAVICVAVGARPYEQSFNALRRGGTLVFVAMPAGNYFQLPIFESVLNGIKTVGSIVGTPVDLAEVYQLHVAGRTKVIYETRRLEQVNEAMAEVEHARIPARLVFDITVCVLLTTTGRWHSSPTSAQICSQRGSWVRSMEISLLVGPWQSSQRVRWGSCVEHGPQWNQTPSETSEPVVQALFGLLFIESALCTWLAETVPSLLIYCTAKAERSDTDGSFNVCVTLFLTSRRYSSMLESSYYEEKEV
jgi:alcohol dehydrogenase, propanol-preferring